MPGAVVVLEQDALRGQRLPQVGVVVEAGEGRVVGLVLEDDQPDVLDLAGRIPRPSETLLPSGAADGDWRPPRRRADSAEAPAPPAQAVRRHPFCDNNDMSGY